MVKKIFNLDLTGQKIILTYINSWDWCTLFAERLDYITQLGSESFYVLKPKIIEVLLNYRHRVPITFNNTLIIPLINLSEPHAALSVSCLDTGLNLYKLDINGKFLRVLTFTDNDVKQFIQWLTLLDG